MESARNDPAGARVKLAAHYRASLPASESFKIKEEHELYQVPWERNPL